MLLDAWVEARPYYPDRLSFANNTDERYPSIKFREVASLRLRGSYKALRTTNKERYLSWNLDLSSPQYRSQEIC